MNNTTTDTYQLQNQNTQYVTDQKIDASTTYQSEMNSAFNRQASETIGAVNAGTTSPQIPPNKAREFSLRALTNPPKWKNRLIN